MHVRGPVICRLCGTSVGQNSCACGSCHRVHSPEASADGKPLPHVTETEAQENIERAALEKQHTPVPPTTPSGVSPSASKPCERTAAPCEPGKCDACDADRYWSKRSGAIGPIKPGDL